MRNEDFALVFGCDCNPGKCPLLDLFTGFAGFEVNAKLADYDTLFDMLNECTCFSNDPDSCRSNCSFYGYVRDVVEDMELSA